jgi:WhiB family transcriptional regulator, redox-sensing transcriptional regulator
MGLNEQWSDFAACKASKPDALFVRGAAQNRAKQVCGQCPVRTECLAEALDNNIEWGRRALLRRRPNVTSWRRLLEAARDEHGSAAIMLSGQAAG